MTLKERVAHYNTTFPDRPPMHATDRWIEGTWVGGNNYRGADYYGAYPPDYLERVWALFPDMKGPWAQYLHLFSGSLGPEAGGVRVDLRYVSRPGVQATALSLPFAEKVFDLTMADTPYGESHAAVYGLPMPDRRLVLREAARVTKTGGFLVWLDTKLPMFRKDVWHWCGSILVIRSTNHDYRGAAIFQRVE